MNIEDTLNDRTEKYGDYSKMAACAQAIKSAMWNSEGYVNLPDIMRESLEMIALKMARIISGDPNLPDNWHDIAGYSLLVERRLAPAPRDLTRPRAMCSNIGDRGV